MCEIWLSLLEHIETENFWEFVLTKDWIPQDCFRTGGVGQPACLSCNKSHTGVTWLWAILLSASISVRSDLLHAYWAYANETHHRRRHRRHRIVIVIIIVTVIVIIIVITIITLSMMIVWSMGNPADLCSIICKFDAQHLRTRVTLRQGPSDRPLKLYQCLSRCGLNFLSCCTIAQWFERWSSNEIAMNNNSFYVYIPWM